MSRMFRLNAAAAVAVLALAMPAFAAQAKPAAKSSKTMTISGTLQKVEGQDLTIQTTKGPKT